MSVRTLVLSLALPLALAIAPMPLRAQGMDAQYTVSLRGITGGTIALRGQDSGATYSVSAAARASGLVGSLVKYAYDATAQGRIAAGQYVSGIYEEREDDDGERTASVTRFDGTTPASVTFTPPRAPQPWDIDPTEQRGVVDALTALYQVLRPVARQDACNASFETFDGRHVARLSLGAAQVGTDGAITCRGEYRRLRGYSAEDLERRPNAELTFVYDAVADGRVQVREIRSRTRLGDAVMRRQ
ncbi:MAG: DUF3108 domain-containing protein [Jannaschia sp.]